jgi:hypothetical protein
MEVVATKKDPLQEVLRSAAKLAEAVRFYTVTHDEWASSPDLYDERDRLNERGREVRVMLDVSLYEMEDALSHWDETIG